MKLLSFSLLLALLLSGKLFSQKTDANIFGHAVHRNEHLPGIHIYIKGTQIGTVTDRTGHYFLFNLPEGEHTVVASGIGYQTKEITVTIRSNTTTEVDFELNSEIRVTPEVVITGSRIEQDKRDAPVVVNIIRPQLFQSANALNIADALGFQSGLRVENNCQNCGFQQVRINGLEGPYSQILIDGRPVFSALAGVYGLEQIPVSMIDRIEVVKGGGSATYGSNAIAGTINIITKDPLYNSFQVGHNISSFSQSTFDNNSFFNTTVLNNGNSGGISIFGNIRNRQAFDADGDGFTEIPVFSMSSLGFKTFNRINKQSKVTVEYHNINDFRRGGNALHTVAHKAEVTEQASHLIHSGSVVYDYLLPESKGRLSAFSSFRLTDRKTYYGTNQDPEAYGYSTDETSFTGIEYLRFIDRRFLPDSWLFGGDFALNRVNDRQISYNRFINQNTENLALFTQGQWKTGRLNFLTGIRADKHNMMRHIKVSPRANILLTANEHLQFRAGYAAGFRAPQAFDEDLHILAVGGEAQLISLSEDLKPETSSSFTFSFEYVPKFSQKKMSLATEFFLTKLNDVFILESGGTDEQGNKVMIRTNGECAVVSGLNFEYRYNPHPLFDLMFGYTFQKSSYSDFIEWSEIADAEKTKRMFRTPDHYGYLNLNIRNKKEYILALTGTYTGSMVLPHYSGYIETDRIETTPHFADVNLKISRILRLPRQLNLEVSLGAKNVFNSFQKDFDKGPERDAGYIYGPVYPRHLFFSLKFGNLYY